jgi:hypothetical protein
MILELLLAMERVNTNRRRKQNQGDDGSTVQDKESKDKENRENKEKDNQSGICLSKNPLELYTWACGVQQMG